MELFHASLNRIEPGRTLRAPRRAIPDGYEGAERELERARKGRGHGRERALFAAQAPWFACQFLALDTNSVAASIHIYRVTMPHPSRHPLHLVDAVRKSLELGCNCDPICEVYWEPGDDWSFFELIDDEMTILEQVYCGTAVERAQALDALAADANRASRLWRWLDSK